MKNFSVCVILILIIMGMYGCSSMNFIPPKYSLATTAYVNTSVAQQQKNMIENLKSETQSMLDSLMKENRALVDELDKRVKSQSFDLHQLKEQSDSLIKHIDNFQSQLDELNGSIVSAQSSMKDSLASVTSRINGLRTSLIEFQTELNKLNETNASIQRMSTELQSRMQSLPDESLRKLKEIIESSLSEQN